MKNPTGIYFEMVVEFFQKLVAGEGVTVERRAKIKDDDGKAIAEVDLLLSGLFGGGLPPLTTLTIVRFREFRRGNM